MTFDHSVDVLIVGSGNGGLTAALCCDQMGTHDVLVIEKAAQYGGTSSLSGGGIWIPCNHLAHAAGAQDSLAEAREYLQHTIPDCVPPAMLDTYLAQAPLMLRFLHEHTRVRYTSLAHYPDYYTAVPGARTGHRSLEPEPLMISELGDEWQQLTQTHHMMYLFDRIAFTQEEAHTLMTRAPGWIGLTIRLLLDYALDITWRMKSHRSRRTTNGCAGVARLRLSMMDRQLPLWLNTAFTDLITDDTGRVIGAAVVRDGIPQRIQARKGLILAAGGFDANQKMREQYLPKPTNKNWSAASRYNTGDAIRAGIAAGAAVAQMDGAWWCTTFCVPNEPLPRLAIMEKSLPGSCVVNRAGKRIANESQNYMAYQKELFARHSESNPCVPAWMVFDARFRRDYIVGPLLTAAQKPDWTTPREYYTSGFLAKANSIAELAQLTGIDAAGLQTTINNLADYAQTGKDLEHQRGDTTYDRYYGDAKITPNPCLAPIAEAPFYAMKIEPGDFGTQGGLVTDVNARVLRSDGSAIGGLYATGNCSAAVLPSYPGPGSTLGPAMTFAWQAAKDICGYVAEIKN